MSLISKNINPIQFSNYLENRRELPKIYILFDSPQIFSAEKKLLTGQTE